MLLVSLLLALTIGGPSALAALVPVNASAVGATATLRVVPPSPTVGDFVTLELAGEWPDICVPRNPEVSVAGHVIQIATTGPRPGDACPVVCAAVITSWMLSVPIGPLAAGSYEVAVTYELCGAQSPIVAAPSTFTVRSDEAMLDHFKCYRVDLEDPRPGEFAGQHEVRLQDQFEQESGATVRQPKVLCTPVSKNGEPVENPVEHLVCYRTEPPPKQPSFGKREVVVTNQLGRQTLRVRNRDNLVCVPSRKAEVPQCGGIAGRQCASRETCDLRDPTCSVVDPAGVCVPRPEICLEVFDPVCGCDGVTYPNDCERLKAGATLAHAGTC